MDNLNIYEKTRKVPEKAQKRIKGGRLSGMTDINPMWRIKTLTELFGPCGIGWKYEITEKRLEKGGNNEIAAFVDINLHIKLDDKWSEAIQGTGGSTFVAKESKGLYTSDECFKMALTDAISVACKMLGFGADIYWKEDKTKYGDGKPPKKPNKTKYISMIRRLYAKNQKKVEPVIVEYLDKFNYDPGNLENVKELDENKSQLLLSAIQKKLEVDK